MTVLSTGRGNGCDDRMDVREGEGRRPRVLMFTHRVPYPPDRGDRILAYHIMKLLGKRCDLAVACTSEDPISDVQRDALHEYAGRIAITPINKYARQLRCAVAMIVGRPATPAAFYSRSLAQTIQS